MGWTFYNSSGEAMIIDGGVQNPAGANFDISSYKLVGNGGSTGIAISANGEVTMAAQPMVFAKSPAVNNVTGDSTVYTMTYTTEVYDQNADFDGTSTFTAPVTGRYFVHATSFITQMTAAEVTNHRITIVASNRSIIGLSPAAIANAGGLVSTETVIAATAIVEMDASDTVTIAVFIAGMSGATADINTNSFLSVALLG